MKKPSNTSEQLEVQNEHNEAPKNLERKRKRRDKKNKSQESIDKQTKSQIDSLSSSGGDQSTVIDNSKSPEKNKEPQSQEGKNSEQGHSHVRDNDKEKLPVPEKAQSSENIESTVPEDKETIKKEEAPEQVSVPAVIEEASKPQEMLIHLTPQTPLAAVNQEKEATDANSTPNLMDESVISVFDSPPSAQQTPRDTTFSPVVDSSIHDSRPIIDDFNTTPSVPVKLSTRTSTPLVQKVLLNFGGTPKRVNTPKVAKPMSSLAKTFKLAEKCDSEETKEDGFKGKPKPVNLLEKSILKSSRRKRSMSVADIDSTVQKRVMFISPQVMEIGTIDERMMASFIEERESSMIKQATGSARRKRSLSTGTPMKSQDRPSRSRKMPDFKAIHQQQFEKMESIADHQARKTERAKKLVTPEARKVNLPQPSKIPTVTSRKPLSNTASIDNLLQNFGRSRVLKRSLSAYSEEPANKRIHLTAPAAANVASSSNSAKKIGFVNVLQRTKSESTAQTKIASFVGVAKQTNADKKAATSYRNKMEERREKNISMYKTNQVRKTVADQRQKNNNILKGVRLNRRFELQMQHRRDHEEV